MIQKLLKSLGMYSHRVGNETNGHVRECAQYPPDFDEATASICRAVAPYTMTSPERIYALCQSVEYIVRNGIPGDVVECGVWKGGSIMAAALTLQGLGEVDRDLFLFDTFDGMPPPGDIDRDFEGRRAKDWMDQHDKQTDFVWAYAAKAEVETNVLSTGYPRERIHFIQGAVESTIPRDAPSQIALLRLDTDWYESTKHELQHLFPRLSKGGVILIDDYGHWEGARIAVDEYIAQHRIRLLLNRVDYTGRVGIKLDEN
jgi:hypothetical protein